MKIITRPLDRIQGDLASNVKTLPLIEVMKLGHRPFSDPLKRKVIFLLSSPAAWPIVSDWAKPQVEQGQADVICLSQGALQSVDESGVQAAWVSEHASIDGLMSSLSQSEWFKEVIGPHLKEYLVVHPCSLGTQLKQSIFKMKTGLEARNLPVYQSRLPQNAESEMNLLKGELGLEWFFYSGSAVLNFLKIAPSLERINELNWKLNCVGQTSVNAFKSSGEFPVQAISSQEAQSMLRNES